MLLRTCGGVVGGLALLVVVARVRAGVNDQEGLGNAAHDTQRRHTGVEGNVDVGGWHRPHSSFRLLFWDSPHHDGVSLLGTAGPGSFLRR